MITLQRAFPESLERPPITIVHEGDQYFSTTGACDYTGLRKKQFRRLAPDPDLQLDGYIPYWSKRSLDAVPEGDQFDIRGTRHRGNACGVYLLAEFDDEQIGKLRNTATNLKERIYESNRRKRHHCGMAFELNGRSDPRPHIDELACDCPRMSEEEHASFVLALHGVSVRFRGHLERKIFLDSLLHAFNVHAAAQNAKMDE